MLTAERYHEPLETDAQRIRRCWDEAAAEQWNRGQAARVETAVRRAHEVLVRELNGEPTRPPATPQPSPRPRVPASPRHLLLSVVKHLLRALRASVVKGDRK